MIRFIGDVHGKYKQYKRLLKNSPGSTIQVGDMGVGFRHIGGWRDGEMMANPPHRQMVKGKHRFIRGNHDNPIECKKHSQWIADGTTEEGVMFVGGALSIDQHLRKEGYSWWRDEELSISELMDVVDKYVDYRPDVMVTHDCPCDVGTEILRKFYQVSGDKLKSRTAQAFQSMWSAHSPRLWVFGHFHVPFDHTLRGTRFVCIPELEYRDFEV